MSTRRFCALAGVVAAVLLAPAGAWAARPPDPLAGRDWGTLTGYVVDRESGKPVAGARVVVEHAGQFATSGRTTGSTDAEGRYQVSALIGRKSSKLDLMSLVEGFPIGLIMPWGLFKHTRIVDLRQSAMRVERAGYKPFVGLVAAQVPSARRYTLHNVDVLLAPVESPLLSAAPPERPRERLLAYSVEPAIAAPGEKVTFTARFRLPQDGARYTAGFYTPNALFKFDDFTLKRARHPDPETGAITFQRVLEIPKRPRGEWAALRLWLDRDEKYNEVELPGVKDVLLQVARTPEEREAATQAQAAFALETQDRPAEALARYQEAVATAPKRPSLWARIGYLSLQLNRPRDSVAAFEKLVATDPEHHEVATSHFATALLAAGETQRALDILTAVEEKADKRKRLPREFLLALARTHLARNDLTRADQYYARAVKIGRVPGEVAQRFHLERARAAVKANPEDPDARLGLARALFDMQRYEEAAAEHHQALRRDPGNVWAHLDLAQCLTAAGRDRDALPHYQQAAQLAPENLEAQLALADCLRRQGHFPEALAAYRQVAAAPARRYDFRVQHGLGLMLLAAGETDAAMEALGRAINLAREKGQLTGTQVYTGLGMLSIAPKRVAIDRFEQPEAALDYALLHGLRQLKRTPESPVAEYLAGAAMVELGLADNGLTLVRRAAARGFAPNDARYVVALAHLRLEQRSEARRLLEELVRVEPEHRRALEALARLAFEAGDTARGQAYLLRARRLEL